MKREDLLLTFSIIGSTAAVLSMMFTASIAMKCNGKLVRGIESFFGLKIAEEKPKK